LDGFQPSPGSKPSTAQRGCRTTLMVRNLPANFTKRDFINLLNAAVCSGDCDGEGVGRRRPPTTSIRSIPHANCYLATTSGVLKLAIVWRHGGGIWTVEDKCDLLLSFFDAFLASERLLVCFLFSVFRFGEWQEFDGSRDQKRAPFRYNQKHRFFLLDYFHVFHDVLPISR
jgi:hypothetical protein